MRILLFIFFKVPRRIIRIIHCKCEYLYYRFFYSTPLLDLNYKLARYLLLDGSSSIENIPDIYQKIFPDVREKKIEEADLVCDHFFDLLGSGRVKLSAERSSLSTNYEPIDWHSDFNSGYHWEPKTFYRYIKYGHKEGVDIKVPWELSRFQHLNTLGQAYVLSGDSKYSDECMNQISDWIDSNPVGFGVNWVCAMEAAIRAVNWLVAMEFFFQRDLFSEEFLRKLYASIYEHGKFIRSHLEYAGKWTTNHYLADIAGLFFISVYCPFFKESREWQEFALEELHSEIDTQVYPDGCSFETSTSYHRLALEMFFYSLLLGQRTGVNFSENYIYKLKKMFESSLFLIKPNGMIPQIGDNDSGRFLRFSDRSILEHKYLLSLAAVYYKDRNFKLRHFESLDEESFWIFGETAEAVWSDLPYGEDTIGSKSFPDAGWHIIRDENDYCFISCGRNGGDGWHSHNDKLSFELMIDGQDIIVDPGTYVYTSYPEERNEFRSTECHNTVKFNGYEQNEMPDGIMFGLPDTVEILNSELLERDNNVTFQGEIQYAGITHSREIIFDKKAYEWQIKDSFSCPDALNAMLIFHLSPELTFNKKRLFTREKHKEIAAIEVEGYELTKETYDYSPEYGVKVAAEKLTVKIPVKESEHTIVTKIKRL